MRLRIVRPLPRELEGLNTSHLKFGASHDVQSPLYEVLLADGYAVPDDIPPITSEVAHDVGFRKPRRRRRVKRGFKSRPE